MTVGQQQQGQIDERADRQLLAGVLKWQHFSCEGIRPAHSVLCMHTSLTSVVVNRLRASTRQLTRMRSFPYFPRRSTGWLTAPSPDNQLDAWTGPNHPVAGNSLIHYRPIIIMWATGSCRGPNCVWINETIEISLKKVPLLPQYIFDWVCLRTQKKSWLYPKLLFSVSGKV